MGLKQDLSHAFLFIPWSFRLSKKKNQRQLLIIFFLKYTPGGSVRRLLECLIRLYKCGQNWMLKTDKKKKKRDETRSGRMAYWEKLLPELVPWTDLVEGQASPVSSLLTLHVYMCTLTKHEYIWKNLNIVNFKNLDVVRLEVNECKKNSGSFQTKYLLSNISYISGNFFLM